MNFPLWTKGLAVGVLAAIPTGPVGIFCFKKSLINGRISGLVSAAGLACANSIVVFIILHGLSIILNFIQGYSLILQFFCGAFFCFAGIWDITKKTSKTETGFYNGSNLARDFMATFLAVLTNPVTFVRYSIIFTFIGLINLGSFGSFEFIFIIFSSILLTWLVLTWIAYKISYRVNESLINRIRRLSNGLLFVLGLTLIINLLVKL